MASTIRKTPSMLKDSPTFLVESPDCTFKSLRVTPKKIERRIERAAGKRDLLREVMEALEALD